MTSATQERKPDTDRAPAVRRRAYLQARYPSWHVWASAPHATRRGDHKDYPLAARKKADWTFTLICGSWNELGRNLAQQEMLDESGSSWNIFDTDGPL